MNDISETSISKNASVDRIRDEIQSLSSEITALKAKIGEHYWQEYLKKGQREQILSDIFESILSKSDKITYLEQEIQILEDNADQPIQPPIQLQFGQIICGSCGKPNDGGAKFCEACGMPIHNGITTEYKTEDSGICPLCGSSLQEDAVFCYTCGARIKI